MAYDGQTVVDLDVTRPDGDAEPKSILDDVTKEIKRAMKQTTYSWTQMQNGTGVTLTPGDVVAVGPSGALILSDTAGSFLKYVVVVENIAVAATGIVAREGGPVNAKTASAVTAFNYVRKSATARAVEDMGVPMTTGTITPTGAIGFSLVSVPSASLCSIFLYAQVAAAPTDTENAIVNMINRTGVVVAPGQAATPSFSFDNSVQLNDAKATPFPVLIAYESIPNNTMGKWLQVGVHNVSVQGPVSRMHFLRKSATQLALESTGIHAASGARPAGTMGMAVSAFTGSGSGTCKALLFGSSADVPAMSLPFVTGKYGGSTGPNTRNYLGLRASLFNPLDSSTVVVPLTAQYSANINFTGRGGRDQANTFNPNTWIYFYLTWDGVSIATRASLNSPNVGPNLSAGETHWSFLDTVRTDPSGILMNTWISNEWSYYVTEQQVAAISDFDVETQIITSGHVPDASISAEYEINAFGQAQLAPNSPGAYVDFFMRVFSGAEFRRARLGITGVSDANVKRDGLQLSGRFPNTNFLAAYWHWYSEGPPAPTATAAVCIVGYKNPF